MCKHFFKEKKNELEDSIEELEGESSSSKDFTYDDSRDDIKPYTPGEEDDFEGEPDYGIEDLAENEDEEEEEEDLPPKKKKGISLMKCPIHLIPA